MPTCSCANAQPFGMQGVNRRQENRFFMPSKKFTRYNKLTLPERLTPWHIEDMAYLRHLERLKTIKSDIDDKPPRTFVHLHINYKKLEQEELRMVEVERDNRTMLERISYVYRTLPSLDNLVSERHAYHQAVVKSIGRRRNQRFFVGMAGENQWMFRRILESKTNYSNKKFLLQWRRNKQFMEQLAQYPVTFGPLAEPIYTPAKTPDGRYLTTFRTPGYDMASCVRTKKVTAVDDIIRPKFAAHEARKKKHENRDIDPAKTKYAWMSSKERSDAVKAAQARKVRSRGTQEQKEKELRMKDRKSTIPLTTSSLIQSKLTPKVPPKVESRIPLKQRSSVSAKLEGKSSTVLAHSVKSIKWTKKRPRPGNEKANGNIIIGDEETEKKSGDGNTEEEKASDGDTNEETTTSEIDASEENDDIEYVSDDDSFWIRDVEDIDE